MPASWHLPSSSQTIANKGHIPYLQKNYRVTFSSSNLLHASNHRRVHICKASLEPHGPGAAQIASSLVVLSSTLITGLYWWFVLVPSERAALSKQKRKGPIKEYLQELEKDESRAAERWFYTEWREKQKQRDAKVAAKNANNAAASSTSAGKDAGATGATSSTLTDTDK